MAKLKGKKRKYFFFQDNFDLIMSEDKKRGQWRQEKTDVQEIVLQGQQS